MKIELTVIFLILFITQPLSIVSQSQIQQQQIVDEDDENIIYDDKITKFTNNQNTSSNSSNNLNNPNISTIVDLDSYLSQNSQYFKQNKLILDPSVSTGECISSYILNENLMTFNDDAFKKSYFPITNLKKLESIIDPRNKNQIYKDNNGNFIIASISINKNIRTKFIFVSKIDFSYFIFPQTGDEIPSLREFMISHVFVTSLNKHVIAIFGGIDYKGSYSNDLFLVDVDYNRQIAVIKNHRAKNTTQESSNIPMGLTEGSLSLITYKSVNNTNNRFSNSNKIFFSKVVSNASNIEKIAVILYGGLTDVLMNNSVYIFTTEKGWLKYPDLNLPKLKGISNVVINNENPHELYGSISHVVNKHSIYIFGGRDENSYNNNLFKLEVSYVSLDGNFSIKPKFIEIKNKELAIGRENHLLLFSNNLNLSSYNNKNNKVENSKNLTNKNFNNKNLNIYLIGGKNFILNKFFDNEMLELDLNGSYVNGKKQLEWRRIPVKAGLKQIFPLNNANFYYDQMITLDDNSNFRFVNLSSSCEMDTCLKIDLKTELLLENNYEKSSSVYLVKSLECVDKNKPKDKLSEFVEEKELSIVSKDNLPNIENNTSKDNINKNNNNSNNSNTNGIDISFIEKNSQNLHSKDSNYNKIYNKEELNHNQPINLSEQLNISNELNQSDETNRLDSLNKIYQIQNKPKGKKSKHNKHHRIIEEQLKSLLKNSTNLVGMPNISNIEEKLSSKLMTNSKEIINQFNEADSKEALRFTQLKEIQTSLIREISESEKEMTEKMLNSTIVNQEAKINKLNSDIKNLIDKAEKTIEQKTSKQLEEVIKRIELVEKNNSKKLESIEKNQQIQREFEQSELSFRKKQMNCINGYLKGENKTCTCYPGYTGEDCSNILICEDNCSNNGECLLGKCYCYPGFKGNSCKEAIKCKNDCSNNGNCIYGKCFCDAEFLGEDCSERVSCKQDCNNKGICFKGKCLCEPGYFGELCNEVSVKFEPCKNNCNNNGKCDMGKCFCYHGFSGENCEKKLEFSCPPYKVDKNSNSHNESMNTKNETASLKERLVKDLKNKHDTVRTANNIKNRINDKISKLFSKSSIALKPCNGNGICQYGRCFCYPGFKGEDCGGKYNCKNDCNNRGICVEENICKCKENFSGSSCELDTTNNSLTTIKSELHNEFPKLKKRLLFNPSFLQVDSELELVKENISNSYNNSSNNKAKLKNPKEISKSESNNKRNNNKNSDNDKNEVKMNNYNQEKQQANNINISNMKQTSSKQEQAKDVQQANSSVNNSTSEVKTEDSNLVPNEDKTMIKKLESNSQNEKFAASCNEIVIPLLIILLALTVLSIIFHNKC